MLTIAVAVIKPNVENPFGLQHPQVWECLDPWLSTLPSAGHPPCTAVWAGRVGGSPSPLGSQSHSLYYTEAAGMQTSSHFLYH